MKYYVKADTEINTRGSEYNEYIQAHVQGVVDSWEQFLKPYLIQHNHSQDEIDAAEAQILDHDKSKWSTDEYPAYLEHFYPADGSKPDDDKDDPEFDKAWLHHIHVNSHHWQHHVLIRDSGETVPLDMSDFDIWEMLCDWHSFSRRDEKSTAKYWWDENKDKMTLSDNTIQVVESLINVMDTSLEEV